MVITGAGIDKEEGLVDAAINAGIITKSGSFFRIGEKLIGQGKEEVKSVIASNDKLREQLTKQLAGKK